MALSFPVSPMKATMGSVPHDDGTSGPDAEPRWAFEIKWDGHRTLAHVDGEAVRFQSTAGHDVTDRWSDVARLPGAVNAGTAILDGEMVVIGDDGRPSFDLVQKRSADRTQPALFQIFDVLRIDDTDTTSLAYLDRRRLLDGLVEDGDFWAVSPHRVGGGADLLAATVEQRLEGIMAKRMDSTYRPGTRSKDWLKIKNRTRVELAIGGYTTGTGRRSSTFGALLVGIDPERADDPVVQRVVDVPHQPRNGQDRDSTGQTPPIATQGARGLRFAGGVGTGFDQATLESLSTRLRTITTEACPFDPAPPAAIRRSAHWVRPVARAIVDIAEFTNDGLVRHASFVGLTE